MSFIGCFIKNREAKNAGWLIGGRIIQMLLSLVVGVLSARYLGPSNYGLVNYGKAYVSFFMSLCTLGINSVIIKDFVDNPNEQGEAIGSTLVLRMISSICSFFMILGIVSIIDQGEKTTIYVTALCGVSLIFHVFDTFNYWFQAQYKSKITAKALFIAYLATSVYRIVLLALGASVYWFAFSSSLDYIVLGFFLCVSYRRYSGPKLSFSWKKSKSLLKTSYHYILSGVMVSIYGHTDRLMLKQMLNSEDVGYYSTATTLCNMWVFVLAAIIDSIYPTIMKLHKENYDLYERKNKQLYAIVFYVSLIVSVGFVIMGDFIIRVLYGSAYEPAGLPLRIITWYTAFSYLGVARNAWLVCENKQKYLKYMYVSAVFINIALNYFWIPIWGAAGAAAASLVTQIFTSIILPLFIKELRRNSILMLQAIMLKGVFGK